MRAKKRFGQHFLIDTQSAQAMVQMLAPYKNVVEIGPGKGALTKILAEQEKNIFGIDADLDMITINQKNFPNAQFFHAPAQRFDFEKLDVKKAALIGNLPYNASKAIVRHCFNFWHLFEVMVFMLQKEVAQSMCASKGKLALLSQMQAHCQLCFELPPEAFTPQPKVFSAVIFCTQNKKKYPPHLETLIKKAFQKPRKSLANNLKPAIAPDPFAQKRAEQLSLKDFEELAQCIM